VFSQKENLNLPFIRVNLLEEKAVEKCLESISNAPLKEKNKNLAQEFVRSKSKKGGNAFIKHKLLSFAEREIERKVRPLSILITVADEFQSLALLLRALSPFSHRFAQVLIVSNGSPQYLSNWINKDYPNFKILSLNPPVAPSLAVYKGLKEINKDSDVLICPANYLFSEDSLNELKEARGRERVVFPISVGGNTELKLNANDDYFKAQKLFRIIVKSDYLLSTNPESEVVLIGNEV
jgi:hypothetical protein